MSKRRGGRPGRGERKAAKEDDGKPWAPRHKRRNGSRNGAETPKSEEHSQKQQSAFPREDRGFPSKRRSFGPRRDGGRPARWDGEERRSREDEPRRASPWLQQAKEDTEARIADWLAQAEKQRATRLSSTPQEFALDPWQQAAFDALQRGESVIVDAPTTAGKTRVVEAFFKAHVRDPSFRAVYTTPVKSLSNDKLREFREMFGNDAVGIATGDVKDNLSAPIVVATLESYRNSLLGTEPDLGRNLVVFDEYHFLQDDSRGSAWEESIILTPRDCQMVLLSASVDNCEEFKAWIEWLRDKPCTLLQVTHRPVPLTDLIYMEGEWIDPTFIPGKVVSSISSHIDHRMFKAGIRPELLAQRLKKIIPLQLTPCIVYAGRRLACENMAFAIMKELQPLPPEESRRIGEVLEQCQKEFKALSFIRHPVRQMLQTYGVGFHHSGLAPAVRLTVEILVKSGLLRFCAATMGLSIGINFAVRSAIITDFERPGSLGFTEYSPSEVLQMLGRAGRRGRDVVGFSLWHSPEGFKRLKSTAREHCESRLRNDPTTFLGLIGQGMDIKALQRFYEKSFQSFASGNLRVDGAVVGSSGHHRGDRELRQNVTRMHKHLQKIGTVTESDQLTPYGEIAKFFPQTGGMFLARELAEKRINETNIVAAAELMAAMCLARFKKPGTEYDYRFPFDERKIEKQLEELYPLELFPELYDLEDQGRGHPPLREFNPDTGFVIRAWAMGEMEWPELTRVVTTEYFGTGDMMNVIYRVSTYLQSLSQAKLGPVSQAASALRESLLREPLSFTMGRSN